MSSVNNFNNFNRGYYGRGGYSGRGGYYGRGLYGYNNYYGNRGFSSYWYPYWGYSRFGYGYPFGYYGGLGYGGFGYGGYGNGGYGYGGNGYGSGYGNGYSNTTYVVTDSSQQTATQPAPPAAGDTSVVPEQYFSAASDAFQRGNYDEALRQASHAAVESPNHPKVHELISLTLFAQGQYQPAAMEAHTAAALGPVSNWTDLYAYYGNVNAYRSQLDKLVEFRRKNPESMEGAFLLGYHNMMMGHKDVARTQMERIVAKMPQDRVAQNLVAELGGKPAPTQEVAPPPVQDPEAQ